MNNGTSPEILKCEKLLEQLFAGEILSVDAIIKIAEEAFPELELDYIEGSEFIYIMEK